MATPAEPETPADAGRAAAQCPNCRHVFREAPLKYCPACGQETNLRAPTLGEFLQQFSGTYFATEGALWRTLRLLLFKPGGLTLEYLAGRRKHYLLPLRLFLSATVVMLLAMRIAGSVNLAAADDPEVTGPLPSKPRSVQLELPGIGIAGLDDGVFYCEGMPQWLCHRVQAKLDVDTRAMVQQMRLVTDRVASHAGVVLFLLLPAFAFGLWLLFRQRRLMYTEHLVFALHLHALWFLVLALMMVDVEAVTLAGACGIVLYGVLALKKVYGGAWWSLLLRAGLLGAVHGALVLLLVALVTLVALLA